MEEEEEGLPRRVGIRNLKGMGEAGGEGTSAVKTDCLMYKLMYG